MFLLSYLDGPARRELFYAEDEDTDTSEKIFKVLDEAFGETRTAAELEDGFHSRSQRKGETLREFANALVALVKRAQVKEPNVFPDKENVLKDRFTRKVTHKGLRRALRDKVEQEPHMTFRALRKYATDWMEEEEPSRALSQEIETEIDEKRVFTPQRQEEESNSTNSTTMSQVLSMLSQQQQVQTKILEQQNKLFEMIGNRQRNQGSYGLQGKPTQIFRCYRCNQPAHRVRDCQKRSKGAIGQAKAGTKSGIPKERERMLR